MESSLPDPVFVQTMAQKIIHHATMHGIHSHFPIKVPNGVSKEHLLEALHEEFEQYMHHANDEYEFTKKRAKRYLVSGFLFLLFCLSLGHIARVWIVGFGRIVEESTLVAGWVAMWRPIELFLYDLPELRKQKHLYQQILKRSFHLF